MSEIAAVIAKLESASEGSRDLDAEIWQAVDPQAARVAFHNGRALTNRDWTEEEKDRKAKDKMRRLAPAYTGSIDAARSALPAGFQLRLEPRFDADGEKVNWRAYAIKPHWERYNPVDDDWFTVTEARHPNEYIAACIAALKARLV